VQAALHIAAAMVLPVAAAAAAASDVFTMTIPNRLTAGLALAFIPAALLAGMAPEAMLLHAAAGAVMLLAGFALFAAGWIGGGDAKLAAAVALWLGLAHLGEFVLLAALFGGVLTLVLLTFRRAAWPARVGRAWVQRLYDSRSGVPYGVALAAAALAVFPATTWLARLPG
jgi:prepilin peptidase CpaA